MKIIGGAFCVGVGLGISATEFLMTYPSRVTFSVGVGLVLIGGLLILDWTEEARNVSDR